MYDGRTDGRTNKHRLDERKAVIVDRYNMQLQIINLCRLHGIDAFCKLSAEIETILRQAIECG